MHTKSHLISFEGIEGCGKSTQIKLLQEFLEAQGLNVHTFREPGATTFGEHIRTALLSSKVDLDPLAQAYAFLGARAQLIHEKVMPLLNAEGNVVILDRYMDSTFAYQGEAQGLGFDLVQTLHSYKPMSLAIPNITFYLKIDLETSHIRQGHRGNEKDYFESKNDVFYSKLIDGYNKMANKDPERIQVIDATQGIEEVRDAIQKQWGDYLNG
jgi:dTMP kinase